MAGFVNQCKHPLCSGPSCVAKSYLRIFFHFPTYSHCSDVTVGGQRAKADLSRMRDERK